MPPKNRVGDRYTLIEKIGAGGMAEVYRARDDLLGREVAVKVLSERFSRDKAFIQRFRREAQSAANLNHPNIVSLYDFGSDKDTYFIVMELIDGRSLDEIIRDEGPLMPERAAEIGSDVAAALDRAHEAGLVHRDIKPSNIMVTRSGETKVTDFGIARAMGNDGEQTMTQTGMVIGTAAYISPEQAQGDPVDGRSDVYSLGCVLFEMLAGRAPFSGETPLAIAYKHVREAPQRPSSLNGDIPPDVDAIILKALAKNPENRYASAGEMRSDLGRFLKGQEVRATPVMADETSLVQRAGGTEVMGTTDYYDEPPTRRGGTYLLAALGILVIFGLFAWLFASGVLGGKEVTVPDVVGRDIDRAREILGDAGLTVEIERIPDEKPEDTVVGQDPEEGETAAEGDTVTLEVSDGPQEVEVPSITGLLLSEAKAELRRSGLKVGDIVRVPDDEIPENEVINQSPDAGDLMETGEEVDLTVSAGPDITVPFVIGQSQAEAEAEIAEAGLTSQVITLPSDEEAGTVVAQDPEAGTEAEEGDIVTITVSEGQAETMPNVVDMQYEEAEELLVNPPYSMAVVRVDGSCIAPPGTVCAQDPEEGDEVEPGDTATLEVQPGEARIGPGLLAGGFFFGVFGFLFWA